jgi:hypothetical protein
MDSILTEKLKSTSIKLINKLDKIHKNIPVTTYNIITYSIFLNAFAVLSLLYGEFVLFVMLFLTSFYLQFLAKVNKNLKNDATKLLRVYGRVSVWIMFGTVMYAIIHLYDDQITFTISILFTIALIICNLNYSLKIVKKIEINEFNHSEDINSYVIEKWGKLFTYIPKKRRENLSKFSKWFDEVMILVIFILVVIYLNYKKGSSK